MSRTQLARTVAHRIMATVLGAQVATMAGLTALESVNRRKRRVHRFPTVTASPVQAGENEVTIHTFGVDLYQQMLDDISRATERIYFETFIWKDDEIGQQFKDALCAAAARGVKVNVVFDEFANLVVPRSFFTFPESIRVKRHPLIGSIAFLNPRNAGRDHRKLLVIDSRIGYVGGYNIGSTYADRWRDTHCRIVGPGAAELENAFVDYWNMQPMGLLRRQRRRNSSELVQQAPRSWDQHFVVHRNTPRWATYPIRNMYLEAIDRATERIWLTQAYLIPDDDLTSALFAAARRGVDVRIIVPARSNHVVADWLSRGFYDELLSCGIRLFLYQGAMIHAKTATIDGKWATIGTANLDRLSLLGNYEVNAEFYDTQVAERMEQIWQVDEQNCLEVDLDRWRSRSQTAKFTETLLAPWRPMF